MKADESSVVGGDSWQVTPRILSPLVLGGPKGLCIRDACGADPWDLHAARPAIQRPSPQSPPLRSPQSSHIYGSLPLGSRMKQLKFLGKVPGSPPPPQVLMVVRASAGGASPLPPAHPAPPHLPPPPSTKRFYLQAGAWGLQLTRPGLSYVAGSL